MRRSGLMYLSSADVRAAMPTLEERLELARRTMIALAEGSELPPKVGVHPRQPASLTGAMPALLRGGDSSGAADLLGIKWVTAFADNRPRGIEAIHAVVVLNDAQTGVPTTILDGGPITAERTAAVSGVVLREWWPGSGDGARAASIALVGAGVQGTSHVQVLAHVAPRGTALTIADRHRDRAEQLAVAAGASGTFAHVSATTDAECAIAGADVVLTMVSFAAARQTISAHAFERARLIVAVDYDMCVPAAVASDAALFLVDDVAQFETTRSGPVFAAYPHPDASVGEALLGRAPAARDRGPIFVDHLGVGLADVVFADAIRRRAHEMGAGIELPR